MKTVSGAFVIVATLAISALVLTGGAYSLTSSVDISGNQMLSDGYALDIYSDTEGTTLFETSSQDVAKNSVLSGNDVTIKLNGYDSALVSITAEIFLVD
mgnify:CR=1 FL=1